MQTRNRQPEAKPTRTLGISLAILASVMLFSIFPFIQMAMILIVNYRFQRVDLPVPGQENAAVPIAAGGAFTGVANASLAVQAALGVIFLVIAFCAWRGRPAWIRFAMLASVVVLTAMTMLLSIAPLFTDPDLNQGIDSGAAIGRTLLSGRLLLSIFVALYVVWYLNRGPARAYYRGYYLAEPKDTTDPLAKPR